MKKIYIFSAAFLFTIISSGLFAQAVFHSNKFGGVGNWSAVGTWTIFSGSDGDGIPDSDDDVRIINGDVITVDVTVTCNSVEIQADGSLSENTTLSVGNVTFTVTNDVDLTSINGGGLPSFNTAASASSILIVGGDINFNADDGNEVPALDIKNSSTLKIGGNFNRTSLNADIQFRTFNSIVEYNGSGSQTIIGATYGKLKSSGTGARILESGVTILIKNNTSTCFDPGTNSYTITGSTIEFGGTSTQTIPAFTYNNLTIGSSGTKTLVNGGTIEVKGTLTFNGTNTYTVTNNTINFSGTSPQTIDWNGRTGATLNNINCNNSSGSGLTINGDITATMVTGNIDIQTGIFDNGGFAIVGNGGATFAVEGTTTFKLTGSSSFPTGFGTFTFASFSFVDYAGTGAQTIAAKSYYHLISSSSGGRTLASGTINIAGDYTITNASANYTVAGNTVNFNGTAGQTFTFPSTTNRLFNNIQIDNATAVALGNDINATNVVGNITVLQGYFDNGSGSTGYAIVGSGGTVFQVNDGATFRLFGTSAFPSGFGTVTLQSTSTVDYNGTGAQTIKARSYANLTSGSSGSRTLEAGTIDISGTYNLINVSSSYTVAGNTVNFNGTSAQVIPMGSAAVTLYNNIKTNNTAGATLGALINTTNVAGGITVETGFMDNGGFAITGNGSATLQVNDGATLKLTGTSTFPTGFGTTTLQTTSSTVEYSGTTQTVSGTPTYHHLTTSGGSTKTLGSALNVDGNLTLGAGTFDAAGFQMNLAGDFTATGTFTHNNNKVVFDGAGAQSVSGNPLTLYNTEAAGTTNLTFNVNTNLINRIDFVAGATNVTFDGSGSIFTLESNGTMLSNGITAQIGNTNGCTLTGNVTWQRYFDGYTDWRMIACPIGGGKVLDDWNDEMVMSGFANTEDPTDPFVSVYTYTEGTGFVAASDAAADVISANGNSGKGFLAYVGNTSPGIAMIPFKLLVTGAPINGNGISPTLTYNAADGFNLIANPYPAAIDFTSFSASFNGSVNNQNYYIYDSGSGSYVTWDETFGNTGGTGSTFTTGDIASGQAFWVVTTGAGPSATFNESDKIAGSDNNFLKKANPNPIPAGSYKYFHLQVSSTVNPYSNGAIVGFGPWSNNFNANEDAKKLFTNSYYAPDISVFSVDGKELSITKMAELTQNISIPVKVVVKVSGSYKITVPDLINGPTACVTLEDKLTGIITDINSTNSYTFNISDTTKAPRFVLHFSNPVVAGFTASNDTVQVGGVVNFTNSSTGATTYSWDFGDSNSSTSANPSHTYTVAGDYTVKLTAISGSCGSTTTTQIIHVGSGPLGVNNAVVNNNDIQVITNGNGTFVKFNFDQVTTGVVEVFDVLGKNVYANTFSGTHNLEQINMPSIGNGIYLIRVSTNNTTLTKRIFLGN